uniref:Uncharacterized protein n=1 Tax=Oryza brachyantha TaxID=4533 RepID=J3MSH6_ORYBR
MEQPRAAAARSTRAGSETAGGSRSAIPELGSGGDGYPHGERRGGSRRSEMRQKRMPLTSPMSVDGEEWRGE